ncbi:DegT/DnrJ/EryC1/StrS family aminotransferase [Thiorhodococcus fuscus]|uniref:DegT/DnrJ/EryC1/StrS family aminotransferase n=1 Tax=Thiorhodococcus fuscus TaxID=527200 RepID=A0ABW4YC05_9GAMM
MNIPQTLPKATVDEDRALIDDAWRRVLDSGRYILGAEVEAFERTFAGYIGVGYGIGVANGTQALEIALRAVGVEAGDRVATVSHTAVATIVAIRAIGAVPVFVDIDPETFLIDLLDLERVADVSLKAVIVVHLYGNLVPPDPIREWCRARGVALVEDCAQAHGASWNGRRAGSLGDIAAFSFYPTKNLGAVGDAGMVVTDCPVLAEQVRLLRQYGWRERFVSATEGVNSRLDPLQAALLGVLLERLDERNDRRRAIASLYDDGLCSAPVRTPHCCPDVHHVYHQYVIETDARDELAGYLSEHGVCTAIHYPVPVHLQPAYARFATRVLPVTEAIIPRILSLPMYPQLEPEAVHLVGALVRSFFTSKS